MISLSGRRPSSTLCGPLLAFALVCFAGDALAQDSTFVERKVVDGQLVTFDDDPVSAIDGQPVGAQLTSFHPARRLQLIRPRSSFVQEMLKSVEAL